MPKLTKRKTGDTFIFTTSKAMGKRIREHCAKTGQPIGPWIRSVVAREVSPNLPMKSWSCNDQWKDEIYKTMAEDVTPGRERIIKRRQSPGKTVYLLNDIGQVTKYDAKKEIIRLSTDGCAGGRVRIDDIDKSGLVTKSTFFDAPPGSGMMRESLNPDLGEPSQ